MEEDRAAQIQPEMAKAKRDIAMLKSQWESLDETKEKLTSEARNLVVRRHGFDAEREELLARKHALKTEVLGLKVSIHPIFFFFWSRFSVFLSPLWWFSFFFSLFFLYFPVSSNHPPLTGGPWQEDRTRLADELRVLNEVLASWNVDVAAQATQLEALDAKLGEATNQWVQTVQQF